MTARQVFEGMLIELSKVNAPSLLLQDFNYLFNKAINLYVNKQYNIYDINQLSTDNVRVLKSTAILTPVRQDNNSYKKDSTVSNLYGKVVEFDLPKDYLHLLNCICIYRVDKNFKCYDANTYVQFAAKRLTADSWSIIVNDFYNRPLPERPYYYIHNVNTENTLPTNPYDPYTEMGTDLNTNYNGSNTSENLNSNLPRFVTLGGNSQSVVEKPIAIRYANPSNIRMEIRYGKDDTVFKLEKVMVDYIKSPQYIRLTLEQIDLTEDTSLIMEFPDYVCQEIINELVHIVMENTADPRLQTHIPVSTSIANPAQALAQPLQAQLQA